LGIAFLRPTRVVRSDVFRLAALFAFLFLSVTGFLLGTVLFIVEGTQTLPPFISGFLDEGVPEAIEVVKQRLGSPHANRPVYPDCYMILEEENGEKLAGNLQFLAPRVGPLTITVPVSPPIWPASKNRGRRASSSWGCYAASLSVRVGDFLPAPLKALIHWVSA
jgi:hypothetical protein